MYFINFFLEKDVTLRIVRFTQWVLSLEDEDGYLGRFQKLLYSDINNGCASIRFDAIAWKQHFEEKHTESVETLLPLLSACYTYYVKVTV